MMENKLRMCYRVAAMTLLFFSSGCMYTVGKFENKAGISEYKPYRIPVKFHVEKIKMTNVVAANANASFFKPEEMEKWRTGLPKCYPGLFSDNPENALRATVVIYLRGWVIRPNRIVASAFGILSLISLGIIPTAYDFSSNFCMKISLKDDKNTYESEWPITCRFRGNAGIIGMILPTRFLVRGMSDDLFYSHSFMSNAENHMVRDDNLKEFLAVFVAAFHRLPQDSIQKLYLSQSPNETSLLE